MIVLERDYTNKSVVCQGNEFHLWDRIIAVPEDTRYGKHYQKTDSTENPYVVRYSRNILPLLFR